MDQIGVGPGDLAGGAQGEQRTSGAGAAEVSDRHSDGSEARLVSPAAVEHPNLGLVARAIEVLADSDQIALGASGSKRVSQEEDIVRGHALHSASSWALVGRRWPKKWWFGRPRLPNVPDLRLSVVRGGSFRLRGGEVIMDSRTIERSTPRGVVRFRLATRRASSWPRFGTP